MKIRYVVIFCFVFLCGLCTGCNDDQETEPARNVKGVAAVTQEIHEEAGGFGTLSFLAKLDITAPQEDLIRKMKFREGDNVSSGDLVIQLENPHLALSLERAENYYSQALAASALARSRLLEGEFQAEAQLLSIKKAEAELVRIRKKWDEDNRRHQNQETLFDAGGINHELILSGRFNLESEREQIQILEKELAIMKIGCRDHDLAAAGIPIPDDETEKRNALVTLMTASLRAELAAANARLDAAEKELRSAVIANNDLLITSNAAGIIGARYFEEGERVKAGEKIITIMDTSSLYAVFPVREKDALRITEGMSAKVQIDGVEDEKHGKVDLGILMPTARALVFWYGY